MTSISVGIFVYNEEKNIGRLLESLMNQQIVNCRIDEIIIVSSGSTDKTDDIIKEFVSRYNRITLILQKRREGKASAINEFLRIAKNAIVVISSGDIIFSKDAIDKLINPLLSSESVGLTSVNPIPTNNPKTFMGFVSTMQWRLHNLFERHGEAIAFRKSIVNEISKNTAVDEAWIEAVIYNKGFSAIHVNEAIVYNKGPESISDFLKQRRRHYAGHLDLEKRTNYKVSSLHIVNSLKIIIKEAKKEVPRLHFFFGYIILELYSRLLGAWDYYIKKKNHAIWNIAGTTKEVIK